MQRIALSQRNAGGAWIRTLARSSFCPSFLKRNSPLENEKKRDRHVFSRRTEKVAQVDGRIIGRETFVFRQKEEEESKSLRDRDSHAAFHDEIDSTLTLI